MDWCFSIISFRCNRVPAAANTELTELAEPVEMPCLCCNTQPLCFPARTLAAWRALLLELAVPVEMPCLRCQALLCCTSNSMSWLCRSRCRASVVRQTLLAEDVGARVDVSSHRHQAAGIGARVDDR